MYVWLTLKLLKHQKISQSTLLFSKFQMSHMTRRSERGSGSARRALQRKYDVLLLQVYKAKELEEPEAFQGFMSNNRLILVLCSTIAEI